MNKYKNFKKMTKEKAEITYGGWAWLTAALPHVVTGAKWAAIGMVGYKTLASNSGQLKINDTEFKWENEESSSTTASAPKVIYYAY